MLINEYSENFETYESVSEKSISVLGAYKSFAYKKRLCGIAWIAWMEWVNCHAFAKYFLGSYLQKRYSLKYSCQAMFILLVYGLFIK